MPCKILIVVMLAVVPALTETAKEGPTALRAASSTVLSSVPLFGANGSAQCDSDANLLPPDRHCRLRFHSQASPRRVQVRVMHSVPADIARNAAFRPLASVLQES